MCCGIGASEFEAEGASVFVVVDSMCCSSGCSSHLLAVTSASAIMNSFRSCSPALSFTGRARLRPRGEALKPIPRGEGNEGWSPLVHVGAWRSCLCNAGPAMVVLVSSGCGSGSWSSRRQKSLASVLQLPTRPDPRHM